jgi:hypothetical protein
LYVQRNHTRMPLVSPQVANITLRPCSNFTHLLIAILTSNSTM